MANTPTVTVSEGRVSTIFGGITAQEQVSGSRLYAVYNLPSIAEQVSRVRVIVPKKSQTNPIEVSGVRTFVVGRGKVENYLLRAFPMTLDGHDFYCVRLGESATLLYDLTTQQWMDWTSEDRSTWRPQIGTNWLGIGATQISAGATSKVVLGDDTLGVLWTLDPNVGYDQADREGHVDVQFPRKVLGGVVQRTGTTQKVGAVYLSADVASPQFALAAITLRTSDDNGKSWHTHGTITVEAGNTDQEFQWRSLGLIKQPGRLFEISDNGATVRIDGLDMR